MQGDHAQDGRVRALDKDDESAGRFDEAALDFANDVTRTTSDRGIEFYRPGRSPVY